MVSIVIIGPESTGKTYLFNHLSKSLSIPDSNLIPEVARSLMERNGWNGSQSDMLERQEDILEETLRIEEEMIEKIKNESEDGKITIDSSKDGKVNMLEDRCGLCCLVYARLLQEERQINNPSIDRIIIDNHEVEQFWKILLNIIESRGALNRYKNSLIILLEPVEEFCEEDGLRRVSPGGMNGWWYTFKVYTDILDEVGVKYQRIGKDILNIQDRVKEVERLLEERSKVM